MSIDTRKSKNDEKSNIIFLDDVVFDDTESTWTITFSESVENHAGMQQIGKDIEKGLSIEDLDSISAFFHGFKIENINLNTLLSDVENSESAEEASILIVRKGISRFFSDDDLGEFIREVKSTQFLVDKKAFMRGRVVNKNARYNLCYADKHQKANYEQKMGTVLSFKSQPYTSILRNGLFDIEYINKKMDVMYAELNYYYDVKKCGIGFHGDSERKVVVGVRVGKSMNLQYQWFMDSKSVGKREEIVLHEGDIYFMSQKATGNDWKRERFLLLDMQLEVKNILQYSR